MKDYPFFSDDEFYRIGSDPERMNPVFMEKMVAMRLEADFGFILTSAWRLSGGTAHSLGRAMDIHVYGERAFQLLILAPQHGMTGIGQRQHGEMSERFMHFDDLTPDIAPRPRTWTYQEKE